MGLHRRARCLRPGDFDTIRDAREDDGDAPGDSAVSDALTDAPSNAAALTYGLRTGDVVVINDDTYISDESGEQTLNFGGSELLRSEVDVSERILLRFDLTAIPTSAQVFSASVTIHIVQSASGATLTARPLLESWTEGTDDGAVGFANFVNRTVRSGPRLAQEIQVPQAP